MERVEQSDRSARELSTPRDGRPQDNMNSDHVSLSSMPVMSFTSGVYQRLDNPLNYLLKELPVVDGNDPRVLCDFLLKVINISKVGHIQEPTIYELLYPYCKGEMGALLKQALTACEKLDLFHA
jgi:hypothetical protein